MAAPQTTNVGPVEAANREINSEVTTQHTADFRHFVRKLGISTLMSLESIELQPLEETVYKSPVKIYLAFLDAIDLDSTEKYLRKFDPKIFSTLFNLNIVDSIVTKFIQRLEDDRLVYDNKEKTMMLVILILASGYCNRNRMSSAKLKSKIIEISFLFSSSEKFDIDFQNDPLIDEFVLQLRENRFDLKEALFMNDVYLSISKSKANFQLFHKRLQESLKMLSPRCMFSFLKYVFTYNTVLFECIDELQLSKLIHSFYKGMNKMDYTVEILSNILQRAEDNDVNGFITQALLVLTKDNKKHQKIRKTLVFRSCTVFQSIYNFIEAEHESFDSLNIVFTDLKQILPLISDDLNRIELLRIVVFLFKKMKMEFTDRFMNAMLVMAISIVAKISSVSTALISFNRECWDDASSIILHSQRIAISEDAEKKKRSNTIQMQICKNGLKFAKYMYGIEQLLEKEGIPDVKRFKKKGFKIIG